MIIMNYRVGIYLRLSNEDKDKKNNFDYSESIKNQRNMLLDYIKKHNNFVLTDIYCDENLSGAGTYRPEFERLINDCKNKKLDIVLCKSQSRFSRDMEVIEKYINTKFLEWNIRFISISDNADTDNYGNKKARQINGLVNEWFLEDISNNIRTAFNSKMKQGEFISPFASYGYEISKKDTNKLIVDKEASIIVKKIYKLYLEGYGYTQIAKYLNQNNIPSSSLYKHNKGIKLNIVSRKKISDIKWNNNAIKTILTNELYIGNLIQGKRTTVSYKNHKIIKKEGTHEAIIPKSIFNKVQLLIKKRTRPIKSIGKYHIFSGIVYCRQNHLMTIKDSGKHKYLVCKTCKKSIRYDYLESLVSKKLNKDLNNQTIYEYIEKIVIDENALISFKQLL